MGSNFRNLVKILLKNGWKLDRVKGSHYIYEKDNNSIAIPKHSKDIGIGLYNTIMKKTGLK